MLTTGTDDDRLREVCEYFGVASLEVFGSTARGEEGPASDVDLLYSLRPGVRLGLAFFDLEDALAEVFGRPVDLVARTSINRHMRERVLADATLLYRPSVVAEEPEDPETDAVRPLAG